MDDTDAEASSAWPELERIAQPARDSRRLAPEVRGAIIAELCALSPLSVKQMSTLLDRSEAYIGDAIRPLVSSGQITFLFPDQPRHPKQKYIASVGMIPLPIPRQAKSGLPPARPEPIELSPFAKPVAFDAPPVTAAPTAGPPFAKPDAFEELPPVMRQPFEMPPPRVETPAGVVPSAEPVAPEPEADSLNPLPSRYAARSEAQYSIARGQDRRAVKTEAGPDEAPDLKTRPFPNQWTNAVIVVIVGIALAQWQSPLWSILAALTSVTLAFSHIFANSIQYHHFCTLHEGQTRGRIFFVLLKGGVAFVEIAIVYVIAGAIHGPV